MAEEGREGNRKGEEEVAMRWGGEEGGNGVGRNQETGRRYQEGGGGEGGRWGGEADGVGRWW